MYYWNWRKTREMGKEDLGWAEKERTKDLEVGDKLQGFQ